MVVAVMKDFPVSTPKQVHSYGPKMVSRDQLEVYSNKPNNSDQVYILSYAIAQFCTLYIGTNWRETIPMYQLPTVLLYSQLLNRVRCLKTSFFRDGPIS